MNNDLKPCPQCAEMIKAEAIKCRYCGSACRPNEMTAGQPQPMTSKQKSPWKWGCLIAAGIAILLLILLVLAGSEPIIDSSSLAAFRESSGEVVEYIGELAQELNLEDKQFKGTLTAADRERYADLERAVNQLIILVSYGQGEDVQALDGMNPEEVIRYFKKKEEGKGQLR